jgi:pimeloyl-ACP methyl ester carboxylesterase
MSSQTAFTRLVTISALGLAAFTISFDAAGVARASTSTEPSSDASAGTIDGLFDVGGGRNLYLHCEGSGSPAVVYLHGPEGTGGSSSSAGEIPSLLSDDYRFCVYDRANVGRSDPAPGPRSPADAVEDLHTLLDVAEVPGPYVLVSAPSFGGDIAFVYAGTYPDDVAGLVFLNPDPPGTLAFIHEFVPAVPEDQLRNVWRSDPEQLDDPIFWLGQLDTAAESFPAVPAILLTPEEDPFISQFGPDAHDAMRELQEDAMDLFDPGEVRIVDALDDMEHVIPEEIAAAVRDVIGASAAPGSSATSAPAISRAQRSV